MNTEKFVVTPKNGKYVNFHCNFNGTMAEAEEYAQKHNYGGGIDVFIPSIRVRNNLVFLHPNLTEINLTQHDISNT